MPIRSPKYKLTRMMVDGAPDEAGVYALWEDDELIYLGRASGSATIRARLEEHLSRSLCPCAENATHYSWELALQPAARELELLREALARHGHLPRCNRDAA